MVLKKEEYIEYINLKNKRWLFYVNQKMHQFGTEILQGNIEVNPCEQGNTESCTYCTFREICAFDGKIPGFEKRKPGHGMDVLKDEQDIIEKMRKQSGNL